MSEERTEITDAEWKRRYAARLMERGGMNEWAAIQCARDAYQEARSDTDADGSFIGPEDAADEEMSYWTNDGED
jgi:hypothetical protein